MRYIHFHLDTDYCGTYVDEYFTSEATDEELDAELNDAAINNASQYDYQVLGWGETIESYAEENELTIAEVEEMINEYYDGAIALSYWKEITKEEYEEGI